MHSRKIPRLSFVSLLSYDEIGRRFTPRLTRHLSLFLFPKLVCASRVSKESLNKTVLREAQNGAVPRQKLSASVSF